MNFPENLLYTSLKRAIKLQIFPDIFMTDWADIWHINCCGGKFRWKNLPKPLKSGFSGSAIFRIFFLSPKLLIKRYPLEKEIISLHGLDCKIRISGSGFFWKIIRSILFFSIKKFACKISAQSVMPFRSCEKWIRLPLKKGFILLFRS